MHKQKYLPAAAALLFSPALLASTSFNFSPDAVTTNISTGVLNGESKELVYNQGDSSKLSELKWKIKNTPIIKGGISWDVQRYITLNANGWTTFASRGSHMSDYDWQTPGQSHWSDKSTHPDTSLNYANQFDLNLTGWLLKEPAYNLGIVTGYQETRYSWTARGGSYNYFNGALVGEFPAGKPGIGYSQKFSVPYIGLTGSYRYQDFDVAGQFKFSPWVNAQDNDEHYMRQLSFSEKSNNSNYYAATVSAGYYVTPNTRLYTELTWTRFAEAKASTKTRNNNTGETWSQGSGAAGLSNDSYTYGVGVQYRF
ncbi:Coagulase/fibrinolysin precursor [Cedecea neteri]|uniref:Coagulase/fibrinolysin n=1 Tax=Cedecea neteri TaxID=158822 RepID=A0A291DS62_9ENTR|nr:omptin family outer membrane protease [Cedecea neteri]ATF90627.1 protease [Cedecea neteri]SQA98861.1 Coagulase/fibrinolysin precursor [Cedecea neteri]